MRLRAATALPMVVVTLMSAGCGDRGGPELRRLDDGVARGPGFSFALGPDWRAVADPEPTAFASTELESRVDRRNGMVAGGAWVLPANEFRGPLSAAVMIEPTALDTSRKALLFRMEATAKAAGIRGFRVNNPGGSLDGEEAMYISSLGGDGLPKRSIVARRGTLLYTITVQAEKSGVAALERLRDQVAETWSWGRLTARDRERLRASRELVGTGYRVTMPPGWQGGTEGAFGDLPRLDSDTLWRGYIGRGGATTAVVLRTPAPTDDLDRALRARGDFEGGGVSFIRRGRDLFVDGERAAMLELKSQTGGKARRQLVTVMINDGHFYDIVLSSDAARHSRDRRAFLSALRTWRWD